MTHHRQIPKAKRPHATRDRNLVSLFALMAVTLSTLACSDDFKTTPHDAAPTSDTSGPCKEGAHRCEGQTRKQCTLGKWTVLERCADAKICTEDLGCIDCLPGVATTCKGSEVHKCNPDGTFGALVEDCLTEPCQNGKCGASNCASGSQLVYVVDDTYNLLAFDPKDDANTLKPIGKMTCATGKA